MLARGGAGLTAEADVDVDGAGVTSHSRGR